MQYILVSEWHWDAFCVTIPTAPCEGSSLVLICNSTHLLHTFSVSSSISCIWSRGAAVWLELAQRQGKNWEEDEWALATRTSGCTSVSFSSHLSLLLSSFQSESSKTLYVLLTGIIFWAQVKLINIRELHILYEVNLLKCFLYSCSDGDILRGLRNQLYFVSGL